jgi:hypothetical protein
MLFLTKLFGVTETDAERSLVDEKVIVDQIVEKVLEMQRKCATEQKLPLRRGTHAKGTAVRGQFEVLDVSAGRDAALATRLAKGIFAKPGIYPAIVRFGNADSKVCSDFKADVRSLSFSVDLTCDGTRPLESNGVARQDFSMQNTTTLPINDAAAFLAVMKLLTASKPGSALISMSGKDKLRVFRTLALVQVQAHQKIKPYQLLRFGSNTPFRHGAADVVKFSATPFADNPGRPLVRSNPNALQDELIRHVKEDGANGNGSSVNQKTSGFDFGVQFLDPSKMTYWGKRYDAAFWTENASLEWNESEADFHNVARLTLLQNSVLPHDAAEAVAFDVTGNAFPDSVPVGSINRARHQGEVASKLARTHSTA